MNSLDLLSSWRLAVDNIGSWDSKSKGSDIVVF